MEICQLAPQELWQQFAAIARHPHASGHCEDLRQYVVSEAQRMGHEVLSDAAGNVMVRTGQQPVMALQAHLDMVPQCADGHQHDWQYDALRLVVDGNIVRAEGTTLGADNGIGVAAMLALMQRRDMPALELLFTADEEIGMHGAYQLSANWITAPVMLNLDTEQEGVLMLGCAGAVNLSATLHYRMVPEVPEGDVAIALELGGLSGGHSGMDIHLGRGNAVKLMNRFLKHAVVSFEARLASFNGGTARNAIARQATALVTVPAEVADDFLAEVAYYEELFRFEYQHTDPMLTFRGRRTVLPTAMIPEEVQDDLLNAIEACHDGVWRMSPQGVDTSSNLAVVHTTDEGQVEVIMMVRSMDEERKRALASQLQSAFLLAGARVEFGAPYKAWSIAADSPLVLRAQQANPNLRTAVVHCGLECGVIGEKYPHLQIVSCGPTIHHPHSPQEHVEVDSVARFWDFLLACIGQH